MASNKIIVDREDLSSLSELIREKAGSSADSLIWPNGFIDTVDEIESGGGSSGETDSTSLRNLINRTITSVTDSEITEIGPYAFARCRSLTSINFPSCTYIEVSAFYDCSSLTSASFPKCVLINNGAFEYCTSLVLADFPSCT